MRSKYIPQGRSHVILDRLMDGPARFGALVAAIHPNEPASRRDIRKVRFVLQALALDGMAWGDGGLWEITDAGRQLADRLGRVPRTPGTSVRIFSEARP